MVVDDDPHFVIAGYIDGSDQLAVGVVAHEVLRHGVVYLVKD